MNLKRRTFLGATMAAIILPDAARAAPPAAEGYAAPAEDALHTRTWMCWPSTQSIYGETGYFESVQETIGRLAAAIAKNEPVSMLVGANWRDAARRLCGRGVTLVDLETDDMWARDCGPVFLRRPRSGVAVADFNFNGWGGKQQHAHDTLVPGFVAADLGCRYFKAGITGEGGGIEYDGEGTLILTESCWVNTNRNPGRSRAEIEAELKSVLGVEKVIWLPGVRGRDITDGHIDGSFRIVRPALLISGGYPGDTSEWGRAQAEAKAILKKETDAKGRRFEIIEIPSAVDVRSTRDDFFSGYANYYVGNGAVYTPQFGDAAADAHAQETLTRLFPGRRVVVLDVDRIYENGGGIHCVTQQQPA